MDVEIARDVLLDGVEEAAELTLIGVAVEAVAGGAGDTIGRVRLNGSF